MTRLKANEATKYIGGIEHFMLGLSTVIDDATPITAEIRHLNEAMLNWIRSRGSRCLTLVIVYESNPELQPDILEQTLKLVSQDLPETPIIRSLHVRVVFLDQEAKVYKELELRAPEPRSTLVPLKNPDISN